MLTPTNQLSGLYLHLGPENSPAYEVECTCPCHRKDGSYASDYSFERESGCPHCHGTGTRRVRLVGAVPIKWWYCHNADFSIAFDTGKTSWATGCGRTDKEAEKHLAQVAVRLWRDDTLPQAVREGLREVDVE